MNEKASEERVAGTVALEAIGLSKSFGHVTALEDVSFSVRYGEILVMVGDNGAGKSTLIKLLSGFHTPDAGEIRIGGTAIKMSSPADAVRAGIATVYQDLALVDTRDVAANLFLGNEFTRGPFVDKRRGIAETERLLEQLQLPIPASGVTVDSLSGGQRQAVAVARTLVSDPAVVIMDEPTAALGVTESAKVMALAARLRDEGRAVLIISHNLQQVWDLAQRIMVLRLGSLVAIRDRADTTVDEIVQLMVYGKAA